MMFATFGYRGSGHGGGNVSTFTGKLWYNTGPPPKEENALFVKGPWTRDIAATSREAEEAIKQQSQ
jgi:hypothetical protein